MFLCYSSVHLRERLFMEVIVEDYFTKRDGSTDLYVTQESLLADFSAFVLIRDAPFKDKIDNCMMAFHTVIYMNAIYCFCTLFNMYAICIDYKATIFHLLRFYILWLSKSKWGNIWGIAWITVSMYIFNNESGMIQRIFP